MKNAIGTAPRAAQYSAPCCSHDRRTAPGDAGIHDYSSPCCSHGISQRSRTAPRADLISFTRRSPFSLALLCCFTAAARWLHRSRALLVAPFAMVVTRDQVSPHHVHHCTASRAPHAERTVRARAWTVWNGWGGGRKLKPVRHLDRAPSLFFAPSKLDFENLGVTEWT